MWSCFCREDNSMTVGFILLTVRLVDFTLPNDDSDALSRVDTNFFHTSSMFLHLMMTVIIHVFGL